MRNIKLILAPVALAVLAGCAATTQVAQQTAVLSSSVDRQQAQMRDSIMNSDRNRLAMQEVNRPYLAGNTMPLAREATMPAALRRSVPITALFSSSPVDLATALQQLTQAAGMSMTATSDALMPASAFAAKTGAGMSPIQAPTRVIVRANNSPLWSVLDDVASQAGASWRPTPNGAEFYRVQTQVFELNAIPQVANTSSSLGRSGGANGQFDSQSRSSFELKDQNVIAGIQKSVEAMLSTGGKMTIAPETQTLVVTDTTEALSRVASYVKVQNRTVGRRVRMLVEVIEVASKDNNDLGVDWNLVYATANRVLSLSSPSSLVSSQAGAFGMSRTTGSFADTSVVIKALSEVGRVVNRRSFPLMTTSGRPVTQALRSTFNYVDQVQAVAIASSVLNTQAQAPTVIQKDETVGTFLTLVPTAKSDGTIFLSVSFDVTTAEPLRPFTVGAGASAVTVQQKTINGTGTILEVPIRSGRTEIIGGVEVGTTQASARRLANGMPMLLGGSDASSVTKSVLVILVTAVAEEGI
jgi:type IVB pilus formation R64 PilN family outer membrane protein